MNRNHSRRARRGDDRGAALVEFAIIAPILFIILFGIIEFGITFNDYQSLRQGAREGAREAVVKNYGSDTSCSLNGPATTAIDDVKKIICQTKDRSGLDDDSKVRVALKVTAVAPAGYENNSVKVCVTRMAESLTGMFSPFLDDRPLRTEIEMRAERSMGPVIDLGNLTDWRETDPSGDNWSWC